MVLVGIGTHLARSNLQQCFFGLIFPLNLTGFSCHTRTQKTLCGRFLSARKSPSTKRCSNSSEDTVKKLLSNRIFIFGCVFPHASNYRQVINYNFCSDSEQSSIAGVTTADPRHTLAEVQPQQRKRKQGNAAKSINYCVDSMGNTDKKYRDAV